MTRREAKKRGRRDAEAGRGLSFAGPSRVVAAYLEGAKEAAQPERWECRTCLTCQCTRQRECRVPHDPEPLYSPARIAVHRRQGHDVRRVEVTQ